MVALSAWSPCKAEGMGWDEARRHQEQTEKHGMPHLCRVTLKAFLPDRWPLCHRDESLIAQGPPRRNRISMRRIFNFAIIWLRGVGDNFIHPTNIFAAYHVQSFQNKVTAAPRREWHTAGLACRLELFGVHRQEGSFPRRFLPSPCARSPRVSCAVA